MTWHDKNCLSAPRAAKMWRNLPLSTLRARQQPAAYKGSGKLRAGQQAALVKWDQFNDYAALESLGQFLLASIAPLLAIISEGRSSQKTTSLCQVLVSHYFWNDTDSLCASATVTAGSRRKQIHIMIRLVGTALETASPGGLSPAVKRRGIRAINMKPRSCLTLFAWETDLPQPFSFSCI